MAFTYELISVERGQSLPEGDWGAGTHGNMGRTYVCSMGASDTTGTIDFKTDVPSNLYPPQNDIGLRFSPQMVLITPTNEEASQVWVSLISTSSVTFRNPSGAAVTFHASIVRMIQSGRRR